MRVQDEEVVLDYDTDSVLCCTCRPKVVVPTPSPTTLVPPAPATSTPALPPGITTPGPPGVTTQPTAVYHTPTTSQPSEFSAYRRGVRVSFTPYQWRSHTSGVRPGRTHPLSGKYIIFWYEPRCGLGGGVE